MIGKMPMPPRPTLIRTRVRRLRQTLDEFQEFETAISQHTDWPSVTGLPGLPLFLMKIVARVVRYLALILDAVLRVLHLRGDNNYLCLGYISPHYMIYKAFPYFSLPAKLRMVWFYDAWENKLSEIEQAFRSHRINVAFVTSRQATEHLNGCGINRFRAYWIPEAVTVADYPAKPLAERTIDVLQMGRRWDQYHDAINHFCRKENLVYLYEKRPGDIIFPTRAQFLDALASSKISICVPSSITHPARSGKIATMTWRYLQSMAAKCLVLGRAPDEMKELFGYDSVIEIDMSDPCGQLRQILDRYTDFVPLIEKNYEFVRAHHQWPNRIDGMLKGMADFAAG